uniref:Uncharacterized protein n=1 Tax=Globisporangium ultimum (strain ATCC 200006 / CBS 805.95 / DAOM BR144) TaxID=431595 RepID=K3WM68_GLOUD
MVRRAPHYRLFERFRSVSEASVEEADAHVRRARIFFLQRYDRTAEQAR